jgi:protein-S-isoprenylcysteine O-methyltransferase Ste14
MLERERILDLALLVLAPVIAGGAMLLFFSATGGWVNLGLSDGAALALDALLSLIFFLQHSGMVRSGVRARMARHLPERDLAAVYALASGFVLALVALLWQRTPARLLALEGASRWTARALAILAVAGFAWGAASLQGFDPFGRRAIWAHLRRQAPPPSQLVIRGPYRWVRHPLYAFTLLFLWADPDLTADRLLLDILWTAWVVLGTVLEERDLAAELGQPYQEYRRRVPMLVPWRRSAARSAD